MPTLFTLDDLERASAVVRQHMPPTPQFRWPLLAAEVGALLAGRRVAVVMSGGNVDSPVLADVLTEASIRPTATQTSPQTSS